MAALNLVGEFVRGITPANARKEGLKLWCVLELQTVQSLLSRPTSAQRVCACVRVCVCINILCIVSARSCFGGPTSSSGSLVLHCGCIEICRTADDMYNIVNTYVLHLLVWMLKCTRCTVHTSK
jgi:hypothetical protein